MDPNMFIPIGLGVVIVVGVILYCFKDHKETKEFEKNNNKNQEQ